MAEQTAVAAPSAAEAPQTIEIPKSGSAEYAEWRFSGKLPEKATSTQAESSPADTPKETAPEDAADSAATKTQEPKRKRDFGAEARIKELTDELKLVRRELEESRRPTQTQAESSPARQQQQYTRPKPTVEDKNQDGTAKFKTYEDYVEELADWKAEQRWSQQMREQQQQAQQREIASKVSEARERYENFDQVIKPALGAIVSDPQISPSVKGMLNDSPVLPDLIFTIASDPKELARFTEMAQTQPGKALRYIAKVESLIEEEFAAPKTAPKPKEAPPAKPGPESAPEPPIDIGHRGTQPMDESQRAFQAIERGDSNAVRAFLKAENAKDLRRRRGI